MFKYTVAALISSMSFDTNIIRSRHSHTCRVLKMSTVKTQCYAFWKLIHGFSVQ